MGITKGMMNATYIIEAIKTNQEIIRDFLFAFGCYLGEEVTIISKLVGNYIVNIKDARYSIDESHANSIFV